MSRTNLAEWPLLTCICALVAGCSRPAPSGTDRDEPAAAPREQSKVGAETGSMRRFPLGFPAPEDTQRARDDEAVQRAATAYRFWYPTVACEAIFDGNRQAGIQDNQSLALLAATPSMVTFTPQSDTPYVGGALDLHEGPFVVELPPGAFIAVVNDRHQRWLMDMGIPGPDAGKGGKHLILPPGYKGSVPSGYHVAHADSFKVLLLLRAIPPKGDTNAALAGLRSIKVYSLESKRPLKYVDITGKAVNAAPLQWEDNLQFWQVLHKALSDEPVVEAFQPMYGLLSALGIEPGKPFAPDARMKGVLERAARVGRDQMLVAAFDSQRPDRVMWKERRWEWASLVPTNGNFESSFGLDLEARDRWFAQAMVASPAMFRRQPGSGSLYWLGHRDKSGAYLDGGKTYKLSVPLPVPGKLFWSVTVYDAQTRSEIAAPQNRAALRSMAELKDVAGSSVDLYFGPRAPTGQEARWVQTLPGRGWFTYFRIYGPEQAAFDATWKPGDFEEQR